MPKSLKKSKTSKLERTPRHKNPISEKLIIKFLQELEGQPVNLYIGISEKPYKGLLSKTWTSDTYGVSTEKNLKIFFPYFAVKTIKGVNIFIPIENSWLLQSDPSNYSNYLMESSPKNLIKHSRYGYISKIKNPKIV